MTETVTVTHLVAGTVRERTYIGERITFQATGDGGALISQYRDGRVVSVAWFAHAEIVERQLEVDA